jgi:hypothetical protein
LGALAAAGKILSPRLYVGSTGNWPNPTKENAPELLAQARLDSMAFHMAAVQAADYD